MATEFPYKYLTPIARRMHDAAHIREEYPDHLPIICERLVRLQPAPSTTETVHQFFTAAASSVSSSLTGTGRALPPQRGRSHTDIQRPDTSELRQRRLLVPKQFTVGQLLLSVRRRMRLHPTQAIFVFVGNVIPCNSTSVAELYERYHDEDGFLYLNYSEEMTWG